MTALAAFFAMIPGALALERGSEANAPLARAILGGLLAGEPATLFVLPVIYTLLVRDIAQAESRASRRHQAAHAAAADPSGRRLERQDEGNGTSRRCERHRIGSGQTSDSSGEFPGGPCP